MLAPPKFHHLHLNSIAPDAAVDFYTSHFATCRRTSWAGLPAVRTGNDVLLVFTQVDTPPLRDAQTAIDHFGWHVTDSRACLETFVANNEQAVLPLFTGEAGETVLISSDTWPGRDGVNGLTASQIAEAKSQGLQPTRNAGFGFLAAPDGAIVEFLGKHPVERFNHVHMFQDDVYCALLWYQTRLNAPVFEDRGPQIPITEDTCRVARGPDPTWPALQKEGLIRSPRAAVQLGEVTLTWYPVQGQAPLASSRGHACDHIGLAVNDLDPWIMKLRKEQVQFLEQEYRVGNHRAVLIEGPSKEAIEIFEIRNKSPST